jgi:hypothetical protein
LERRAMLTPGPNCTLAPLSWNSFPMAAPQSPKSAGSQLCATWGGNGRSVRGGVWGGGGGSVGW